MMLHPWVAFAIMPLFAFANAGMPISFTNLGSSITLLFFLDSHLANQLVS
jgi:NhaA family Na+:H+ antiporter